MKRGGPDPVSSCLMFDFVREAIKDIRNTGSVWPSSPSLAKEMTRALRDAKGSKRVLEVGPGTGPFTRVLLRHLHAGDEFDLVELNPAFCEELERRLLAPFRSRHPGVRVDLHEHRIEEAPIEGPYHFIVCGLPFNNFPPKLVRSIFKQLMKLLHPGGELVYFEYAGVRVMKGSLSGRTQRGELKRIGAVGRSLRRRHQGRRKLVLGNLPPAMAVRLRKD